MGRGRARADTRLSGSFVARRKAVRTRPTSRGAYSEGEDRRKDGDARRPERDQGRIGEADVAEISTPRLTGPVHYENRVSDAARERRSEILATTGPRGPRVSALLGRSVKGPRRPSRGHRPRGHYRNSQAPASRGRGYRRNQRHLHASREAGSRCATPAGNTSPNTANFCRRDSSSHPGGRESVRSGGLCRMLPQPSPR